MKEDIVYAFQFSEDGCGGFDISQVTVAEFCKSRNTGAPFMKYVYNTKQEAIDAMIKRLEELKDD
ncbi:MAG: hypothetical protein ACRC1W_09680 [Shewanella sp.]